MQPPWPRGARARHVSDLARSCRGRMVLQGSGGAYSP